MFYCAAGYRDTVGEGALSEAFAGYQAETGDASAGLTEATVSAFLQWFVDRETTSRPSGAVSWGFAYSGPRGVCTDWSALVGGRLLCGAGPTPPPFPIESRPALRCSSGSADTVSDPEDAGDCTMDLVSDDDGGGVQPGSGASGGCWDVDRPAPWDELDAIAPEAEDVGPRTGPRPAPQARGVAGPGALALHRSAGSDPWDDRTGAGMRTPTAAAPWGWGGGDPGADAQRATLARCPAPQEHGMDMLDYANQLARVVVLWWRCGKGGRVFCGDGAGRARR